MLCPANEVAHGASFQKTFMRYWDFSIPSAEVRPTAISKYNTALQLILVGATTVAPLVALDVAMPLLALQYVRLAMLMRVLTQPLTDAPSQRQRSPLD